MREGFLEEAASKLSPGPVCHTALSSLKFAPPDAPFAPYPTLLPPSLSSPRITGGSQTVAGKNGGSKVGSSRQCRRKHKKGPSSPAPRGDFPEPSRELRTASAFPTSSARSCTTGNDAPWTERLLRAWNHVGHREPSGASEARSPPHSSPLEPPRADSTSRPTRFSGPPLAHALHRRPCRDWQGERIQSRTVHTSTAHLPHLAAGRPDPAGSPGATRGSHGIKRGHNSANIC